MDNEKVTTGSGGFAALEDEFVFNGGMMAAGGMFADVAKDMYYQMLEDENGASAYVNRGTAWGEDDVALLNACIESELDDRNEHLFTLFDVASMLKRTPFCIQEKLIELLDERNANLAGEHRAAYEEVRYYLASPVEEEVVAFISLHDFVNHFVYTLIDEPQFDRFHQPELFKKMIEANYAVNEIAQEMGEGISPFGAAARLYHFVDEEYLHIFGTPNAFIYFNETIKDLKEYVLSLPGGMETLLFRTWSLSLFFLSEQEANDNTELYYTLPLDTHINFLGEQELGDYDTEKPWTAQDSLALKRGLLRGDALNKIARSTTRTPLSLLLELSQPRPTWDAYTEEDMSDIAVLIKRIAAREPSQSVKSMTTSTQRRHLASMVQVAPDV